MKEIQTFLDEFNSAWEKGDTKKIESYLDDEVIFLSPDKKTELKGKSECLETISEYMNNAETKIYTPRGLSINIWNQTTAVINMDYYIEYSYKGQYNKETGRELWTLIKRNDEWKLVYRALMENIVLSSEAV